MEPNTNTHESLTWEINILNDRLVEFAKRMTILAKKANRYGSNAISFDVIGEPFPVRYDVMDWDGTKRTVTRIMRKVVVTGTAPRVGNYEFVARVNFINGSAFISKSPSKADFILTQFHDVDGHCDHCKSRRARKEVFVVRNRDTGEMLQVGSSCLRDFLGIDDPRFIAANFAFSAEASGLARECEEYSWSSSIEGLLVLASVAIRLFGWCSKSQAERDSSLTPTVSYAALAICDPKYLKADDLALRSKIINAVTDEDRALALKVIEWVRSFDGTKLFNDFNNNLSVLFRADYISGTQYLGMVIAAMASYHREMEYELRKTKDRQAMQESKWVGEIKERIRGRRVTLVSQKVIGSSNYSDNDRLLIMFMDEGGDILIWWTETGGTEYRNGEKFWIDGTVKKHDEFNGLKQTILSRVKIHATEPKKPISKRGRGKKSIREEVRSEAVDTEN